MIVDLKDYFRQYYETLSQITIENCQELMPLVITAAPLMLIDRKQLSMERIAAFVKKFATMALHLPSNCSLALMGLTVAILQKYPRSRQLIDNEGTSLGQYQPEVEDPDHCNAFSSKLYELTTLKVYSKLFLANYLF